MPRGLNKVMIIGNLGADPELKYTPSGQPVTTFRVAVGRTWRTPEGENRDETEWFRVVAWNKLAETCNEYLRKGSKVYIEGRFQTRSWEKDGQKQYMTELVANEMQMIDSRQAPGMEQRASGTAQSAGSSAPAYGDYDQMDDDIPF